MAGTPTNLCCFKSPAFTRSFTLVAVPDSDNQMPVSRCNRHARCKGASLTPV